MKDKAKIANAREEVAEANLAAERNKKEQLASAKPLSEGTPSSNTPKPKEKSREAPRLVETLNPDKEAAEPFACEPEGQNV